MRSTRIAIAVVYRLCWLAVAAATGCASEKHDVARGAFTAAAPFSKTIAGSGDSVCWSVKRALLSQGYMLGRSNEPGVLTGTRDYQPEEKLNVTLHLQAHLRRQPRWDEYRVRYRGSRGKPPSENEAVDKRGYRAGHDHDAVGLCQSARGRATGDDSGSEFLQQLLWSGPRVRRSGWTIPCGTTRRHAQTGRPNTLVKQAYLLSTPTAGRQPSRRVGNHFQGKSEEVT